MYQVRHQKFRSVAKHWPNGTSLQLNSTTELLSYGITITTSLSIYLGFYLLYFILPFFLYLSVTF